MPAHFSSLTAVLVVEQIEPTRKFLVERLGFVVRRDGVLGPADGAAIVERGAVAVIIQSTANLRANAPENYDPGPYKAVVYIEVDDVEMLVPEVIDADIVMPLGKTSRGTNEIGVREPGGNVLVFASRLAR